MKTLHILTASAAALALAAYGEPAEDTAMDEDMPPSKARAPMVV